jgi:hypothetical protein
MKRERGGELTVWNGLIAKTVVGFVSILGIVHRSNVSDFTTCESPLPSAVR